MAEPHDDHDHDYANGDGDGVDDGDNDRGLVLTSVGGLSVASPVDQSVGPQITYSPAYDTSKQGPPPPPPYSFGVFSTLFGKKPEPLTPADANRLLEDAVTGKTTNPAAFYHALAEIGKRNIVDVRQISDSLSISMYPADAKTVVEVDAHGALAVMRVDYTRLLTVANETMKPYVRACLAALQNIGLNRRPKVVIAVPAS